MFGALAKLPPGAIPQDIVDSMLYRQGFAEVGTKIYRDIQLMILHLEKEHEKN